FLQFNSSTMNTLIISKEIEERQEYFPWLKKFIRKLLKTFPQYDKALKYLSKNVEKEIAVLSGNDDHKIKIEALFETINSLFLHFWWKIHWVENRQWKKYWKIDAPYSYCCNDFVKYAGKLLYFLIYLGIILSEGVSNSIWINRILQAINVFPSTDDIVYSSLLQILYLKKKHHHVYMNILKHVLCTNVPLHINEPTVYLKSMMLYKRLRKLIEDAAAKATVTSIAAKIKPPPDIIPWLSSYKIYLKSDESILYQLSKKEYFKKLKNVLLDAEPSNKKDNLSETLKNKRKKKEIKIDSEEDKSFFKNFDSKNVLDDVNKRSKKLDCFKMSKSKSNENEEETLVNKDYDFVKLSCANEVDFSDIKSQMKDVSKIKPTSKKEKCLKEKDIFSTTEKKINKCKVKQNIKNLKKAKCKIFNAAELGESTCINSLPSLITNYNSSEERYIKSRFSPLEASDTSNIRDKIPDKISKQCASNKTKIIQTVSIKLNDYSENLTSELYDPILGDMNNNEIHAVSNQTTDNCLSHDLDISKGINDNINTVQETNVETHIDADGNNSVNSNIYENYLQNNRIKRKISPHKQAQKRVASQTLEYVIEGSSIDGSKTSKQVEKRKKRKSRRRKKNNVVSFDDGNNAEKVLNSSDLNIEVSNTEIIHLNELSNCDDCFTKENEFIDGNASCTILQQNKELQKFVSSGEQLKDKPKYLKSCVADESSVTDKTTTKKFKKWNFKVNLDPSTGNYLDVEIVSEINNLGIEISKEESNKVIIFDDSSHLLHNQGDSAIQEEEPIQKKAALMQNTVCNKLTSSSKNSVGHETSEISAHEADEESGIFDLSFDKENKQKCNKVHIALVEDIRTSQSNLFDASDQNLLPNFGSELISGSNSFQGVHPVSKIDQQKKQLPKDVNYIEDSSPVSRVVNEFLVSPDSERNMIPNSIEVKENLFLLDKDSYRNKITMNPISSSAYASTPKDSSNGEYQNHSAKNLKFLMTDNINESTLSDFVSNSNLSIRSQHQTPKSLRHNKNIRKTKDIFVDKIEKKKKKLAEMNLKQVDSYRNAKICSDTCLSSDKEINGVFSDGSDFETSPSLFPTQKRNASTFKNYKRKLIISEPCLHLPESCESIHRSNSSNLSETCDKSNKLPAISALKQKSQPKMNDTLEKSINHTYNLRNRRSSIERRRLYVV
ncbi:uncharacterized protein TNCT_245961, partial [Trichonephila clavata]